MTTTTSTATRSTRRAAHAPATAAFGLLLALAASAVPAAADYRESYARGVQAIDRGRWDEAASAMREAIAERPQAGGDLVQIYGRRYEDYLPHYNLGLALYRRGDLEGARRAWQESERQGAIRRARQQYREMQKLLAELPPPEPPPRRAAPPPDLQSSERQAAEERLREQRLEEQRAADQRAEEQRAEAERGAQAVALRGELEELGADVERVLRQVAPREAGEPAVARAGRDLRALRSRLQAPDPDADPERLAALRGEAAEALAAARSALARPPPEPSSASARGEAGPPPALLAAARAYFAGDYETTLKLLAEPDLPSGKAMLQSHLLQAAALHSLWRLGGEADPDLLRRAAEHTRACRRLDPAATPDQNAFSPRFLSFFRSAGPPPGKGAAARDQKR